MGQYSKRGPKHLENVQKLNRKFIKTLSVHSKKQLLRFKKKWQLRLPLKSLKKHYLPSSTLENCK